MDVNDGKEYDNAKKKLKIVFLFCFLNKVIQSEEFNMKENRRYNVSVSTNHLWDLEKTLARLVLSLVDV